VYYEVDGELRQRLAPGFAARFMHYVKGRLEDHGYGTIFKFSEQWPDQTTLDLVGGCWIGLRCED